MSSLRDQLRTAFGAPGGPGELPVRGTVIDHFVVVDWIGEGAMGLVVSAYDTQLDRKVALKFLHHPAETEAREGARLLREAQAMGRVRHPNVVTIYQVGSYGSTVYLAMELVEGRTLRAWAGDAPRGWRKIVSVFALAGRGLAAAHEQGVVHRDFKPDNVLVEDGGRVLVTDFGVAALADLPAEPERAEVVVDAAAPIERLTETGMIVGTPAYMAPEQHRREAIDARADQFSFCVALFEALHGHRPFAGATMGALLESIRAEAVEPPRRGAGVPARIQAALVRGLRRDPAARFPDMEALLAALERDPGRDWRRAAILAGGAAAVAVAAVATVRRADICAGQERGLAGVWDEAARTAVTRAFDATGRPNAADTAGRVIRSLDDYAGGWATQRGAACRASAQGEQSGTLLDLRMSCLDRRRGELRELAALLARSTTAKQVDDAVAATLRLSELAACADTETLLAGVPPPADPAARAEAQRLRDELDRLHALDAAGRYPEQRQAADAVLEAARKLAYAPVLAEALATAGEAREHVGDYAGAEGLLDEAATAAAAAHDDGLAARVWLDLLILVGDQQRRGDDPTLRAAAEAAVVRAGDTPAWRRRYWNALGRALLTRGRFDEAAEHTRRALALATGERDADLLERGALLNNLGLALAQLGRDDEARVALELALALRRRVLGAEHPTIASVLGNLGMLTDDPDPARLEQARAYSEQAIAMRTRLLGRDHVDTAKSLTNLGIALDQLGRHEEAETALREAIAIKEKALGPEHPNVGASYSTLAMALVGEGRTDDARAAWDRSLALEQKAYGKEHPAVAGAYGELARAYIAAGRWQDALPWAEQALPVHEKLFGAADPRTVEMVLALGRIQLQLGHPDAVRPLAQRALAAAPANGAAWVLSAELKGRLGDAGGAGADAERAYELAGRDRNRLVGADVRARAALLVARVDAARGLGMAAEARALLSREPGRYHSTLVALAALKASSGDPSSPPGRPTRAAARQ